MSESLIPSRTRSWRRPRVWLMGAAVAGLLAAAVGTIGQVHAQAQGQAGSQGMDLLCSRMPLFCGPPPAQPPAADRPEGEGPALRAAKPPVNPPEPPRSLRGVAVPTPDNLEAFIADKAAAIRLGKALFWDMQVGSDGETACASCHFHAGADSRSRNQLSPGLTRMTPQLTGFDPDTTFQLGGPNYQAKLSDFPFHKLSNPNDRNSTVLRSVNDTFSSQGVFKDRFVRAIPGSRQDERQLAADAAAIFGVGGVPTRLVPPVNSPSVINAVFNFRNFWDGRAQYLFNGVNPFGGRDADARVYKTGGSWNGVGPTPAALTCGVEWSSHCVLPAGLRTRVWYGADGKWTSRDGMSGTVACSNATFGDPNWGVVKACLYDPDFGPPESAPVCAAEGGQCTLGPGVGNVWYGSRNGWVVRANVSGTVQCTNAAFGTDPLPGVVKACRFEYAMGGSMAAVKVRLNNASLASQASGPPLSSVEMSADGRRFMDIGKRVLAARPLHLQKVHPTDSVLGPWASATTGLNVATYEQMVRAAFRPVWWNGTQALQVDALGNRTLVAMPTALGPNQYTHMQANFSLLFSLALQMYQSTLVSDDSPFDRHMNGVPSMTASQLAGMNVFWGKGKCASCHGGPEFTNASVRYVLNEAMSRMVMGNGGTAVYDEGFYNIAVRQTREDLLNGGVDPKRNPISLTGLLQRVGPQQFERQIGIRPNLSVSAGERIAVNGAAKAPTVRNVELTAPYFHNGGSATLRQVVEFYNRGGNFAAANRADLDSDIEPLGLTDEEMRSLVDFLKALTDDRVRFQSAPFDHPQLLIPNGHRGDTRSVQRDGAGRAVDEVLEIPATGAAGTTGNRLATPANFLNTGASGSPWVRMKWLASNALCLRTPDPSLPLGMGTCAAADTSQQFRLVPADGGGFSIVSRASGLVLGVDATWVVRPQGMQFGSRWQVWHVQESRAGVRLYNAAAQRCLVPDGRANAALALRDCSQFNSSLTGTDPLAFDLLEQDDGGPALPGLQISVDGPVAFQTMTWHTWAAVRVTPLNGLTGPVTLSVDNPPAGLFAGFWPSTVPAGSNTTLWVARNVWANRTVPLTVRATAGSVTTTVTVMVTY